MEVLADQLVQVAAVRARDVVVLLGAGKELLVDLGGAEHGRRADEVGLADPLEGGLAGLGQLGLAAFGA